MTLAHARAMRSAVAVLVLAACIPSYKIDTTTDQLLTPNESRTLVRQGPVGAAQLVIAKLGERGYTLVALRHTDRGFRLELVGNRDFSGTHTIGSTFYVWVARATNGRSQIRLVGKPTHDHIESCPAIDAETKRKKQEALTPGGTRGVEEAGRMQGVCAEIALDGLTPEP